MNESVWSISGPSSVNENSTTSHYVISLSGDRFTVGRTDEAIVDLIVADTSSTTQVVDFVPNDENFDVTIHIPRK